MATGTKMWLLANIIINIIVRIPDNTIDLAWRNFLSPEFGTKFQRKSTVIFGDIRISLQHSVG